MKQQLENPENGLFDHDEGQTFKKAPLGELKERDMETHGNANL